MKRKQIDTEPELEPYLTCIDHTVSRETFELWIDPEKEFLVTRPQPSKNDLPSYYESEDYISHTDSSRSIMDKAYQFVKRISLNWKFNLVQKRAGQKGRILDVGCGTGDLLAVCEKRGWKVKGVEPNAKARKLAIKKLSYDQLIVSDITKLKMEDKHSFDVITMWHVLEHVPNLSEYIKTLKSLLAPGGCLFVAVPNYKSYDAKKYKEFWAAYDVPRHLWHFSQNSIRYFFGENNFEVVDVLPLVFDSFYVSLLSEKYKTGKANLFSGFKNGMISNLKAKQSGEYSSLIYIIKNI